MKYDDKSSILLRNILDDINKSAPVVYLVSMPAYVPIDKDTEGNTHVIYLKNWLYTQLSKESSFDLTKHISIGDIHQIIIDMVQNLIDSSNITKEKGFETLYIVANSDWSSLTNGLVNTDFLLSLYDDLYSDILHSTVLDTHPSKEQEEYVTALIEDKRKMDTSYRNSKYGRAIELTFSNTFSISNVKEIEKKYVSPNTVIIDVFTK